MIYRLDDWHFRLLNYLSEIARRKPGDLSFNCGVLCAGAIKAMTGHDLMPNIGEYKNTTDALRKLKKAGFRDHVEIAERNFEKVNKFSLFAGDIAVVPGEIDNAGGIVQGSAIYVWKPECYLGTVPLDLAKYGFHIPYAVKE